MRRPCGLVSPAAPPPQTPPPREPPSKKAGFEPGGRGSKIAFIGADTRRRFFGGQPNATAPCGPRIRGPRGASRRMGVNTEALCGASRLSAGAGAGPAGAGARVPVGLSERLVPRTPRKPHRHPRGGEFLARPVPRARGPARRARFRISNPNREPHPTDSLRAARLRLSGRPTHSEDARGRRRPLRRTGDGGAAIPAARGQPVNTRARALGALVRAPQGLPRFRRPSPADGHSRAVTGAASAHPADTRAKACGLRARGPSTARGRPPPPPRGRPTAAPAFGSPIQYARFAGRLASSQPCGQRGSRAGRHRASRGRPPPGKPKPLPSGPPGAALRAAARRPLDRGGERRSQGGGQRVARSPLRGKTKPLPSGPPGSALRADARRPLDRGGERRSQGVGSALRAIAATRPPGRPAPRFARPPAARQTEAPPERAARRRASRGRAPPARSGRGKAKPRGGDSASRDRRYAANQSPSRAGRTAPRFARTRAARSIGEGKGAAKGWGQRFARPMTQRDR